MTALYIFISFVASALTSMLLMPWILSLCKRNGYFDRPNDRKVHKNNTPRLGGVVFVPSAIVGIAATLAIVFNFYGEIARRTPIAKAANKAFTDAKARRCGYRTGLDTLVVRTVNDGCPLFAIYCERPREIVKHPTWGVRRQR